MLNKNHKKAIQAFSIEAVTSIAEDIPENIASLLEDNNYPDLTIYEKEIKILILLDTYISSFGGAERVLKYLFFDYQLSEKSLSNSIGECTKRRIEILLNYDKLNEELAPKSDSNMLLNKKEGKIKL